MSETSEQRKAQDRYITDLRAKHMAEQRNKIDGTRSAATDKIAQMAADSFDRVINAKVAKGKKKGK